MTITADISRVISEGDSFGVRLAALALSAGAHALIFASAFFLFEPRTVHTVADEGPVIEAMLVTPENLPHPPGLPAMERLDEAGGTPGQLGEVVTEPALRARPDTAADTVREAGPPETALSLRPPATDAGSPDAPPAKLSEVTGPALADAGPSAAAPADEAAEPDGLPELETVQNAGEIVAVASASIIPSRVPPAARPITSPPEALALSDMQTEPEAGEIAAKPQVMTPVATPADAPTPDHRALLAKSVPVAAARNTMVDEVAAPRMEEVRAAPSDGPGAPSPGAAAPPPTTLAALPPPDDLPRLPVKAHLDAALSVVNEMDCGRVSGRFSSGRGVVALEGYLPSRAAEQSLLATIRGLADVASVDHTGLVILPHTYCQVMDFLNASRLRVSTEQTVHLAALNGPASAGIRRYREGENIEIKLKAPDYPAYLYVDYFDRSGGVVHLLPNTQTGLYRFAAKQPIELGGAKGIGFRLVAAPPFGTDLVVAIGSSYPLFEALRPDTERAPHYLRDLALAVAAMKKKHRSWNQEFTYSFVVTEP